MRRPLFLLLATFTHSVAATDTAPRKTVASIDDLPRYGYPWQGSLTAAFDDPARFAGLVRQSESDLQATLRDYAITDRATLSRLHHALVWTAQYRRDWPAVRREVAQVRAFEDKPLLAATADGWNLAYAAAAESSRPGTPAFRAAFRRAYAHKTLALPWALYGDAALRAVGGDALLARATVTADAVTYYQPQVDRGGQLDERAVRYLTESLVTVRDFVPLKTDVLAVDHQYLAARRQPQPDIWPGREMALPATASLHPVVVAVWDSGTDPAAFPGRLWTNARETPDNGRDDDGNGFVDDVHGIAVDEDGQRETGLLRPVPPALAPRLRDAQDRAIGMQDQQNNFDTPSARRALAFIDRSSAAAIGRFFADWDFVNAYGHGTHTAGIAARGNPTVRLLIVRRSFAIGTPPRRPTLATAQAFARHYQDAVAYMRAAGVRVVNMSWSVDIKTEYEDPLAANGVPEAARAAEARRLFDVEAQGLRAAIASAPGILFVGSAGNHNDSAAFTDTVPAAIEADNVLTVAAVGADGHPTTFTSTGPTVDLAADGYNVDSVLPNGFHARLSGTSMASPYVANVAAKLLAVRPTLTVARLRALLLQTATPGEGGLKLVDGRAALAALAETGN